MHSINTPEYAIMYLGAASAGITLTTINPASTVCEEKIYKQWRIPGEGGEEHAPPLNFRQKLCQIIN